MPTFHDPTEASNIKPKLSLFAEVANLERARAVASDWKDSNIQGTFFASADLLLASPKFWRTALEDGNEIGHPGVGPFSLEGTLDNWTVQAVREDLDEAEVLLKELGQQPPFTLLMPGPHRVALDGDYTSVLAEGKRRVVGLEIGANSTDIDELTTLKQSPLTSVLPGDPVSWWIVPYETFQCEAVRSIREAFDFAPISEVAATIEAIKR